MSTRMRYDRYLISATVGGFDFHAYFICQPDKTERLIRRLTNLVVGAIEKETEPRFWLPIVLVTKLKTGREVEELLFKNCPEIEAKLAAPNATENDWSVLWAAEAADPDSIALMDLH
jgi:hypothetical protein